MKNNLRNVFVIGNIFIRLFKKVIYFKEEYLTFYSFPFKGFKFLFLLNFGSYCLKKILIYKQVVNKKFQCFK